MKKFLLKLIFFTVIMVLLISGLITFSDFLVNRSKERLLTINSDIQYVFAGNSTLECAVDDRVIKHSVNIAQAGEAYMYTYSKLKALLEANEHIRQVFISFSYADILMEKEETWLFSDYFIVEKVQYYNYLLDRAERTLLFDNNTRAYVRGVIKSAVKNLETFVKSYMRDGNLTSIPNFGGYKYLSRDKLEIDPGLDTREDQVVRQSPYQVLYLKKISDLCRQHDVRLVLLNPPKYKSYNENVNNEIRQNWVDVRQSMETDSLVDLSGFLMPDSCYADLSHLNFRGAKVFSGYLNDIINREAAAGPGN
jgi:hypothetical protein